MRANSTNLTDHMTELSVFADGLYRQSAVIPYRANKGRIEILLITTRKGRWIVPKGVIEPDLSPPDSAAKEALEEAGVIGVVRKGMIGRYSYEKWGGACHVEVYVMRVKKMFKRWEDDDFRTRQWLPLRDAIVAVSEPALKKMLKKLPLWMKQ